MRTGDGEITVLVERSAKAGAANDRRMRRHRNETAASVAGLSSCAVIAAAIASQRRAPRNLNGGPS